MLLRARSIKEKSCGPRAANFPPHMRRIGDSAQILEAFLIQEYKAELNSRSHQYMHF